MHQAKGGVIVSILQTNIDFLARKFSHVAQAVTKVEYDSSSVYTERVEKDHDWIEAVQGSVGDFKLIFMYGFGQGLALIDLLEQYPDRWIFVYEPNVHNFYEAIQKYNLIELFQHPGFKGLAIGEEHLKMLFSSILGYMQYDLAFVAHRHYLENSVEELYTLKQQFMDYSNMFDVNQRTMDHFRIKWMTNSMYQLASVLTSPAIEALRNTFRDSTAVVIGSGPSLQQDIEWLNKFKPHALIIAAGSSIQALVKHGIQPHLTVVMDAGEVNEQIFIEPESLVPPLLLASTAYYGLADKKNDNLIYSILRNDLVTQFFVDKSTDHFLIEPTSTVTGTAMQAAICLGVRKIIMMGQDLSFPNDQFYADGIVHAYTTQRVHEAKDARLLVENVEGTHNVTTPAFMFMKDGLELMIESFPEVQFINATRQGAKIAGSVFMTAEEILPMIESENIAVDAIEQLLANQQTTSDHKNIIQDVKQKVQTVEKDLKIAQQELKNVKKMLDKVQTMSRTKPLKAQQLLEQIEREWAAIVNRDWFEPIMECIIPAQLSQFDKHLPEIITEKNIIKKASLNYLYLGELVNEITNALIELYDIFQVSLQRLDSIHHA